MELFVPLFTWPEELNQRYYSEENAAQDYLNNLCLKRVNFMHGIMSNLRYFSRWERLISNRSGTYWCLNWTRYEVSFTKCKLTFWKENISGLQLAMTSGIGTQTNLPLNMSWSDIDLALSADLMSPICQYDFRPLFLIVDQHILPPWHFDCTKNRTFIKRST